MVSCISFCKFGVSLRSVWDRFGSAWKHFGVTLGPSSVTWSLLGNFAVTFGSFFVTLVLWSVPGATFSPGDDVFSEGMGVSSLSEVSLSSQKSTSEKVTDWGLSSWEDSWVASRPLVVVNPF